MNRPFPQNEVLSAIGEIFAPAPDVWEWAKSAFLKQESPLYNVEHDHLNSAYVGVLWTNVSNSRHMKAIAGQAEMPLPQGGKWQKGRALYQLEQWFGVVPDFLVTLSAPYAQKAEDAEFCALVEHEMYHCAQAQDAFGLPKFTKEGKPKFAIRGHDVEEFVGIVRRYGVGAAAGDARAFVKAANSKPEVATVDISSMCGTCVQR